MLTYAVRQNYVSVEKYKLFNQLVEAFNTFPDFPEPDIISCHAVCRALVKIFEGHELTCVDGYFHTKGHDHSWLDLGGGIIADMYPIAGCNPFLVDAGHFMIPWNKLYIKDDGVLPLGSEKLCINEKMADMLVNSFKR